MSIRSIPPWVPIDKRWRNALPHNITRPFTELEAAFSLSLDHDGRRQVTLRGLAKLWRWSTGKVSRFLARNGVEIDNFGETHMTTLAGQWRDTGETAKVIDSRWLSEEAKQQRDSSETPAKQQRDVLKNPNRKPNPNNNYTPPDWVDLGLWKSYLDIRTKKKVPNTPDALALIIVELEALKNSGNPIKEVLEQSIRRGYPDVYPAKKGSQGNANNSTTKPSNGNDDGTRALLGIK